MNRRIKSRFSFFSRKKEDDLSPEGVVVKDFFDKPILWFLLGFGIASLLFFFLGVTKEGVEKEPGVFHSRELQYISNQLLNMDRSLDTLQQRITEGARKDEQLLLTMGKVEKFLAGSGGSVSRSSVSQTDPTIELRMKPKPGEGSAGQVTKTASTQKTVSSASKAAEKVVAHTETYTVQAGDTLFSIARRNQVPLAQLFEINGLEEGAVIRVGQTLMIPR